MKTTQSLKFFATVLLIASLIIIIKGCKKTESNGNTSETASIKNAIKTKYGADINSSVMIPVNKQPATVFYKNPEGRLTNLYGADAVAKEGNGINIINPNCQYNCSNTTNPANLVIVYTLVAAERYYICEGNANKSSVLVKWTLSAPFSPSLLTRDQNFPNTSCTVTFTPTSGSAVSYSTTQITAKAIGTSPGCGTHGLYEFTCRINNVPNTYFNSGWTIGSSISLDVDCSLLGNVSSTSLTNAPAFSQDAYLPCNRIDAVFFNPPGGGNNYATVTGLYTTSCTPPSGMQAIDNHQFEYRQVTSSTSLRWEDQNSNLQLGYISPSNTTQSSLIYPYGGTLSLLSMTSGSGWWLIRYRNVKNGSCNEITPFVSANPGTNWGNSALWYTEAWNL